MNRFFENFRKISAEDCKSLFFLLLALIPSLLFRWRKKHIWIIFERIDSADDNGWHFYQWLRENHPDKNVFFLLGRHAKQFNSDDKYMVAWRSFKHYIVYLASDIHIKTVFKSPRPNERVCAYVEQFLKKNVQTIYLRHGISKDGVEMHHYSYLKVRLFLCGAEPEYRFFLDRGGYPNGYLAYTGFARYDDLLKGCCDKRFILLMPTWRRYLTDNNLALEKNEETILHSDYFRHYQSLINNPNLIDFLRCNDLKLIFCLHPEFAKYKHLFGQTDNNIVIVDNNEVSIHQLLMETSLLITDYSSVFFDVAYMLKPIVYYHFDYKEFREKHLSEGYFSYEKDGMGTIVQTEQELIQQIKSLYNGKSFVNPSHFINKCNAFFQKRDANNCQRIFDEIVKVEECVHG